MRTSAPRLVRTGTVDLPVFEASGLAPREVAGRVLVIGDRSGHYVATAVRRLRDHAKKALGDISALGVGPDRSLWLLSDKSRAVGRLALTTPLPPGGSEISGLDELWQLPQGTKKPEGMVVIDEHRLLAARDTNSMHDNGIIVERPTGGHARRSDA